MRRYTLPFRLTDVITLITVLAVDKYTFRTFQNLADAIRGNPQSAGSWQDIAESHPEFFRFNGKRDHIALLIRSYFPEDEDKMRAPLTVSETQKLIDVAINLHEKEIQRIQRNSHWFPIIVSVITIIGLILTTIYNTYHSNNSKEQFEILKTTLQRIEAKIR